MKTTGYTILTDPNPTALQQVVLNYLKEGWELYGFPFAFQDKDGDLRFAQAVVTTAH